MKEKIQNILNKQKEIINCKNMIFEKENDILSCIKAVGEDGVRSRQKKAAVSLLELKNNKEKLRNELVELCKSFDINSFKKKKITSKIVAECISQGISKENLTSLKQIYQNI